MVSMRTQEIVRIRGMQKCLYCFAKMSFGSGDGNIHKDLGHGCQVFLCKQMTHYESIYSFFWLENIAGILAGKCL